MCPPFIDLEMSLRRLAHRLDHLVACLNVVQLRLQKQCSGLEFVCRSCVSLRAKRGSLLQLLRVTRRSA